jgi:CMP/dCMP kinase
MIIAIDGPAGAGKTTISSEVARRLEYVRLDTGALYRAVALCALEAGFTPQSDGLGGLVEGLNLSFSEDGVTLDGVPLGQRIRTAEMSQAASAFSAVPAVRAGLLELQRRIGRSTNSVLDGRDIGTVVFPDAHLKIFLTASPEERARRRHREHIAAGRTISMEAVLKDIMTRDHADSTRAIAPLRQAEDAQRIDSSDLTIEETIEKIVTLARERAGG